jgi:16S rRNA (uracil1498-N3)-methyltransferase
MSVPRFLVSAEALSEASAQLTGPELRHLKVRRVDMGGEVVLCDGSGRERRGILGAIDRQRAVIRFVSEVTEAPRPALSLVLAQALIRPEKLDLVVEKATELGVSGLVLFCSERSTGRAPPERIARWHRVAASAAKQCQRATLPRITGPVGLGDILSDFTSPSRLLFWEQARAGGFSPNAGLGSVLAVVGPEGGFTTSEAQRAESAGFRLVGLGPHVLRAETAAIVAVVLCQFLYGDLGRINT